MTSLSKSQKKNTYLGLIAVLTWSFAAIGAVCLKEIPPFEIMTFVFSISFLVVLLRLSRAEDKKKFLNFNSLDLLVASATLVVNHVCYYLAFRFSPAAEVDLIAYMWPTLLLLLTSFFPGERLCLFSLLAGVFCFGGLYILLCPDFEAGVANDYMNGYLYAFVAAIAWTLYCLYTRYRHANSSNCISFACGIAAAVSLLIHLIFEDFFLPGTFELCIMVLLGIFEVGLAYYFWDRAVKGGSVKVIGLASYTIPLFSILILVMFGIAEFEKRMITATLIITMAPLIPLIRSKWKPQPPLEKTEAPPSIPEIISD